MDRHKVTNAEFCKFVEATGYQTIAERPLSKEQFPDLMDYQRQPGSLVFQPPKEGMQVETILFVMSLCLLVYNLGQRELRNSLKRTGATCSCRRQAQRFS